MLDFLNAVDSFLYYPILLVVLSFAGLYFSVRTRFVQIRLLLDSFRALKEKPQELPDAANARKLT